jgi:hypothetical protein
LTGAITIFSLPPLRQQPAEEAMAGRLARAWAAIRKNGPGYGLEVLVNGLLPIVIYLATDKQLGDVGALIASSVPPILWSIYQFVRSRRVDAFSLLIITGIVLSMLALFGGGGPKFLQLRENLVTGVIGLIFLGSVLVGRPLIYYLARAGIMRNTPNEAESFDAMRESAVFKHTMLVLTLVWGFGLVARTAIACVLVFQVPIPTYLALNPVLGYASSGILIGFTVLYVRRRRRIGNAMRAAVAAQAQALEAAPPGH